MNKVIADGMVEWRHPDQCISKADAVATWDNAIRSRPRIEKSLREYLAIGIDGKGRVMELVAIHNDEGNFLIYHAFIPPTENAKRGLGMSEGGRRR